MKNQIAILGIVVENNEAIKDVNDVLHEYGSYIIGRLGIPYHYKEMNIITVVLDATEDIINDISEKINSLQGIECNIMNLK